MLRRLVAAWVLAWCGAGCEIVIPVEEYRGDPLGAGAAGGANVANPRDSALADASPSPDVGEPTEAAAQTEGAATGVPADFDVASNSVRDGSIAFDHQAEAADTGREVGLADAQLPEGATPACHLACDGTFCCVEQVCCPSVCGTKRCVLGVSCPSKAVACEL